MATMPISGRNTNGGLVMTSNPLRFVAAGVVVGCAVGAKGDSEAIGDAEGEGDCDGDGEAKGSRLKLAHGFGCTLAQIL
jgi:hypothetical protein